MNKFLVAFLLWVSVFHAADVNDWNGTWKFDAHKSDFSKNPAGAPRQATLTYTNDSWSYKATDANGKQTDIHGGSQSDAVAGSENTTSKSEPTGNPFIRDVRFAQKDTGKETIRVLIALLPDGNSLVIYGSGTAPDGKEWSAVSYYKKAK